MHDHPFHYRVRIYDISMGRKRRELVETTLETNDDTKAHLQYLDDCERIDKLVRSGQVDRDSTIVTWEEQDGNILEEKTV